MDAAAQEISKLGEKIKSVTIPPKLAEEILVRLDQLSKLTNSPTFLPEYDRMSKYIDWVTSLPWEKRTQDLLELEVAKKVLDKNHYGLVEVKDRILEYISVMKLKQEKGEGSEVFRAPILCFVGPVGTGKTTIAYSIAEDLKKIPAVVECHWVSGKYALFIKIVAKNNEDLRKILHEQIHYIEGVGSTDSFISFGLAFEKNVGV